MEEGCQRLWNVVEVRGSEVVVPHTPWGMVEEVGPPVRRALHWGRNGGAPGRRRRWAGMLGDLRPRKTLQWERGEGRRLCGSRSPGSRGGTTARRAVVPRDPGMSLAWKVAVRLPTIRGNLSAQSAPNMV